MNDPAMPASGVATARIAVDVGGTFTVRRRRLGLRQLRPWPDALVLRVGHGEDHGLLVDRDLRRRITGAEQQVAAPVYVLALLNAAPHAPDEDIVARQDGRPVGLDRGSGRASGAWHVRPAGRRTGGFAGTGSCGAWCGPWLAASNDVEQLGGHREDERGKEAEDPSQLGTQGTDLPVEVGLRLSA